MKRFFLFIAFGLVFLAGCGADVTSNNTNVSAAESVKVSNEAVTSTGATKEFSITAKQFSFDPASITVNKGDHVKITLTSADVEHGFSLSQFGVNTTFGAGETKTVEFDATKSGTFTFLCSVVCGSGHTQMKGTLVVQ